MLYSHGNGEPLKDLKEGDDRISFIFQKDSSGACDARVLVCKVE